MIHPRIALLCLPAGLLALSSCAQTSNAEPPATTTVVASAPATTTTTLPATTTEEPTTSTETPTTTTAPITTQPSNVEVIGAFDQPIAAVGSQNGRETEKIQWRLIQLGFWAGSRADGLYGQATTQAVMAFQKYLGLRASGKVDEATAAPEVTAIGRNSAKNAASYLL